MDNTQQTPPQDVEIVMDTQPTQEAPAQTESTVIAEPTQDTKPPPSLGRPCLLCTNTETIMTTVRAYIADALKDKSMIPYYEELAIALDVDEDTITNWMNKKDVNGELEHPAFFGAIKKIRMIQKVKLLKRTNGRYQPTGAIFQLKVNHGLIEAEKRILAGDTKEPLEIIITEAKNPNDE